MCIALNLDVLQLLRNLNMELLALNCIVEMYYQQRCRCQPIEIERQ